MVDYPINLQGTLCEGQMVSIGWPEPNEYDLITNLRNEDSIRKWFLDSRKLDLQQNRQWLEYGINKPIESLLSIRLKNDNSIFLGTVGWSDWDYEKATACFGRLMVNHTFIKKHKSLFPRSYMGVAVDAGIAIRDFAMLKMNLSTFEAFLLADNLACKLVNNAVGLKVVGKSIRKAANESIVETIDMALDKEDWLKIKSM